MKPSASADRFAEEQKRQQEEDLLINAIYKDYGKLLKKLDAFVKKEKSMLSKMVTSWNSVSTFRK